MMRKMKQSWTRLARARKGAIYVELAATLMVLFGLFIGTASVGSQIIDSDRDTRAMRGGVELLYVLDTDSAAPSADDFATIAQKMGLITNFDPREDYGIIFTALEFDHTGAGLRVDWTGRQGALSDMESRVSIDQASGVVRVDGIEFDLRDDERLMVVEMVRMRRGLFLNFNARHYSKAVAVKYDPSHA